jgi:hypothetical protein
MLEQVVRREVQRQQRLEFQRYEPQPQQQQRQQRESGWGRREFIRKSYYAKDEFD